LDEFPQSVFWPMLGSLQRSHVFLVGMHVVFTTSLSLRISDFLFAFHKSTTTTGKPTETQIVPEGFTSTKNASISKL
jgi:hypothetical protein